MCRVAIQFGGRLAAPSVVCDAGGEGPFKVTVSLTYWTNGDAEFELKELSGTTILDLTGPSCWHPRTRYTHNADGTQSPPGGPEFVIVKVRNSVDVVEHGHVPAVFRMSDNPGILREARESIARGECRRDP